MYAELGSTWRFLMRDPDQAAHGLGKLLKHCGPDNVLWGTDSIWYDRRRTDPGICAFQRRAAVFAKARLPGDHAVARAKIFGLNAMKPLRYLAEE